MTEIEGGATIWARQTIDSEIFYDKPDKWFKIWFYIVNRVNHTKNRKWERGSCFMTYEEIEIKTKATKDQIAKCLTWFRKQEMLATQQATRGITVTVLRYDFFQDLRNYESNAGSKPEANQKQTRSKATNKNGRMEEWKNVPSATSVASGEEKESKRKPQPHFEVVEIFFRLKGWDMDYAVAKRYLRGASELLKACNGDIHLCEQKMQKIKQWADLKVLDWSLETVLKRWFELDAETAVAPKKAYIEGDRAYQDGRGDWHVILSTGEHRKWVGSLDDIKYA